MPMMQEMLQSKYLKKEDFPDPVLMTVASISKQNIAKEDEKPEYKYAMHFEEVGKPLLLNSTNIKRAAAAFGSQDSDDWIGKKIVVYNDENVEFGGQIMGGIRLRAYKPKSPANKPRSPVNVEGGVAAMDDDVIPF